MKNKNKAFLKRLLIGVGTSILLLFVHMYSIDQIKSLNSKKSDKLIQLKNLKDELEASKVEVQKLSSKDVIISKASEKLGLIKSPEKNILNIDHNKISLIEDIVNNKYD